MPKECDLKKDDIEPAQLEFDFTRRLEKSTKVEKLGRITLKALEIRVQTEAVAKGYQVIKRIRNREEIARLKSGEFRGSGDVTIGFFNDKGEFVVSPVFLYFESDQDRRNFEDQGIVRGKKHTYGVYDGVIDSENGGKSREIPITDKSPRYLWLLSKLPPESRKV